jgi:hypothetical protein
LAVRRAFPCIPPSAAASPTAAATAFAALIGRTFCSAFPLGDAIGLFSAPRRLVVARRCLGARRVRPGTALRVIRTACRSVAAILATRPVAPRIARCVAAHVAISVPIAITITIAVAIAAARASMAIRSAIALRRPVAPRFRGRLRRLDGGAVRARSKQPSAEAHQRAQLRGLRRGNRNRRRRRFGHRHHRRSRHRQNAGYERCVGGRLLVAVADV